MDPIYMIFIIWSCVELWIHINNSHLIAFICMETNNIILYTTIQYLAVPSIQCDTTQYITMNVSYLVVHVDNNVEPLPNSDEHYIPMLYGIIVLTVFLGLQVVHLIL